MSYLGQVELKSSDIRRVDVTSSTSATHTLTWIPPSEQSLIVTINGVKQQNNYTISGTTLTLDSALIASDELEVVGILDIGVTNIPADDSITNAMVKSDAAIAKTKLASLDIVNADVNASAAIVQSKLVDVVNADIGASADIAGSKLADNGVTLAKLEDGTQGDILYYGASGAPARLGFGTTGDFLKTQGTGANPIWATVASSGLNSVQVFTSSGTWTKPAGITKVIMEVQGAGAGGGHDFSIDWVRNGGGGGYAQKFLDVSSIASSTITVGTGGAGIASAATTTAGGDSSWADGANTITGGGSQAPSGGNRTTSWKGRVGGVASGGDINIDGGGSCNSIDDSGSFGMSVLGQEGYGCSVVTTYQATTAEMDGIGYGGGGGARISGSASPTSGSGANGIVIVWEYK